MPVLKKDNVVEFHNYVQRKLREKFPDWATNFDPKRFKEFSNPYNFWAFTRDLDPDTTIQHISKRISSLLRACKEHDVVVKVKVKDAIFDLANDDVLESIKSHTFNQIRTGTRKTVLNKCSGEFRRAIDTIISFPSYSPGTEQVGLLAYFLIHNCLNRDSQIIFPSGKSGTRS